ncbi:hypothetical protein MES4922_130068 [Mesorhizobium ventifaucium]|uniref:Uncharacterized protein n=1 Tax=Mesorhizobium ventifaucium TaxID=666020 RepID=A0ABN8JC36_9HYPH|nr:hypothetical protein MES4922_130068 [Mesorhizobium ventifaucium]
MAASPLSTPRIGFARAWLRCGRVERLINLNSAYSRSNHADDYTLIFGGFAPAYDSWLSAAR